jgi:hypothetical protein
LTISQLAVLHRPPPELLLTALRLKLPVVV